MFSKGLAEEDFVTPEPGPWLIDHVLLRRWPVERRPGPGNMAGEDMSRDELAAPAQFQRVPLALHPVGYCPLGVD